MKNKFNFKIGAYSLIELSIVLVIISALVAGAMTVSIENLKDDQVRVTKERMEMAYKMMGHYIRVNKKLPCPALTNKVKSVDSDYGNDNGCAGVANGTYAVGNYIWGAVPVAALGLTQEFMEDGFGSKIFYFVDKRFTYASDFTSPPDFTIATGSFSITGANQLGASPLDLWTIKESPTTPGSRQDITKNAVFGFVSLGANKAGAYNSTASTPNTAPTDADELTNQSATTFFVSSSPGSNSYDDVVFYRTFKDIIADYPDVVYLIPCDNTSNNYINGTITGDAWYDGIVYSKKTVCSAPNQDMRYSKKCSVGGSFVVLNESCAVTGASACSLTNGQALGNGNQYFSGTTQAFPTGSLITDVKCSTNFGRNIVGGSRTSDDTTQTCSLSPTDRTTDSGSKPQAICSNGAIYVINGCTACRGCYHTDSTSGTIVNDQNVSGAMSCNSDTRPASSILDACRSSSISYSVAHMSSAMFGHVKIRKCNCPCEQRNLCNAATLQCRDGYFYLTGENDHDESLGSNSSCYSPVINCSSSSQSCGNGC